ncbi:MAG: efflux RND transporter permease subunit [Pseudomonadales bacterium]|nr:efflux RND transporter permease subunit [Pseudomonadales bacterium]
MNNPKLNAAGWLASTFITSKLTILVMLSCTLLGVLAILMTSREENPQIVVPGAEIMVSLPGASAEEVEQLLVYPLEAIVREIPGVDHTYAVAYNSLAVVSVQFEVGQDKERSLVKLYDRILGKRGQLPLEASTPLLRSVDVDDVPVVTVTLSSSKYDDFAMKRIADRMVERLHTLESVSIVKVRGGRDLEVRVELDPERLLAFGITLNQISSSLKWANVSVPMRNQVREGKNSRIHLDSHLTSVEDVKRLIVGVHNSRPIYLADVADVKRAPQDDRDALSRFAFGPADSRFGMVNDPEMPAVTISVAKKTGTNAVTVSEKILERIGRLQKNMVPDDVHVVITRNDGARANHSVNNLIEHMGIAVLSVFVVVVLFLGIKEALIVGITVPLILGLTLGIAYLCGLTINRISLFGLILSLGLLVDSAIVVIENIHRHYKTLNNQDKRMATIEATNEIGSPTNLATFAIMLVFLSLLLVTGMMGQYFYPIAFNVPVAMLASLVVAYIVTPWAAHRFLKPAEGHGVESENIENQNVENQDSSEHHKADRLHQFYHWVIGPLLSRRSYRYFAMLFVIVLILLSLLQPAWQFMRSSGVTGPLSAGGVALALLPKDNKNTFNVTITLPETAPIELTDQLCREVGSLLRNNSLVTNYQVWLGQTGVIDFNGLLRGSSNKRGPNIAEIRVNLVPKNTRDETSIVVVQNLRTAIEEIEKRYAGSTIQLVEDPPGPPVRATVLAEIYGVNLEKMRELSGEVRKAFEETYDMVEVTDSEVEDVRQYRLLVDREKAALSGVSAYDVANAIRRLVNGENLGRLHVAGEKQIIPIRLHIPRKYQIDPIMLSRVFVTNRDNQKIPLSELTRSVLSWEDRPIQHKDFERVTYVGGELRQSASAYAVIDLDRRLDNLDMGDGTKLTTANLQLNSAIPDTIDGYHLLWDGEMRLTLDTFGDMLVALGIALIFIYLMLVGYYRSFLIPLVAMSAIPLGLVGVFPGHWIMGQSFSAASMIGVIALSGVVVRNSLLIIDFILDYLKLGMPLREAVSEAGAVRMRPIILTALAIILGSAVMLTDPMFSGLAISLIFGTLASTVLTLIVVPLILYSLVRRTQNKGTYSG